MTDAPRLLDAVVVELARRMAALAEGVTPDWGPLVAASDTGTGRDLPTDGVLGAPAAAADLDHVDVSILLAAAIPALEPRFRAICAGIFDGASPWPTVEAIVAVNGLTCWDRDVRIRFGPDGGLVRAGLVEVDASGVPLPAAAVAVPERVVAHLVGDERIDSSLVPLLAVTAGIDADPVVDVCRVLRNGIWNVWIHDASGVGPSVGASALAVLGAPAIVLDLRLLPPGASLGDVLPTAWREATLQSGGVVAGPVDARRDAAAIATLPRSPVRPTILVGPHAWDPTASAAVPFVCGAPRLAPAERERLWRLAIEETGEAIATDAVAELSTLRLGPDHMFSSVAAALTAATAAGEPLSTGHLRAAALAHGSNRLVDLARRIMPEATFDDLVVAPELLAELQSLPGRHATRHVVREEWGLGRGGGRGLGLTCLFAGSSGTGKTLAAEVVANALGVDLFIIDLSQIVDKFIGETEKNLERVFAEAEGVNGVLLFDEADALFGKRSKVQSAHDRHANVEVAYLLQRMERYDGIAILTTNLRGNIDDAFQRRLDVVCTFLEPSASEREQLWRIHLPSTVPIDADVDVALLARHLDVAGGVIRNITITAAHAAAIEGRPIAMADLVRAAAREFRKMGRLFKEPELSAFLDPRS